MSLAQEGVQPPPGESIADTVSAESEGNADTSLERIIETDRNSFTFTPMIADPGRLISEISYSYFDVKGAPDRHSFPELLFRYGITKRFELRFGWNYEIGGSDDPAVADVADFFGADARQQIYYGAKFGITDQKGRIPASAVYLQGHTPTGPPESATQLRLGYVFGWELKNKWIFDAGFVYGTDVVEGDHFALWAPSAVLKIPFGPDDRWFTHLEYFSVNSYAKEFGFSNHFFDTGLHHLISDNLEVGGILGFGLNDVAPRLIFSFGVGYRY